MLYPSFYNKKYAEREKSEQAKAVQKQWSKTIFICLIIVPGYLMQSALLLVLISPTKSEVIRHKKILGDVKITSKVFRLVPESLVFIWCSISILVN
jgi:hypothetical protein